MLNYLRFCPKILRPRFCSAQTRIALSTKASDEHPLLQFFDSKTNWGKMSIQSERNMLMTMMEEHARNIEHDPNSERFEKVEESMEALLEIVSERDRSVTMLEKGEWHGPEEVVSLDELGREVTKLTAEYSIPKEANPDFCNAYKMAGKWHEDALRKERENEIREARETARKERYKKRKAELDRIEIIDDEKTFARP